MAEQLPENFDWVTARAQCSIHEVFERLRAQVKQDVETRERMLGQGGNIFRFADVSPKMFSVVSGLDPLQKAVRFECREDSILIAKVTEGVDLEATVTLSNDGKCRVRIQGQEYDLWQLRKMALEGVLF